MLICMARTIIPTTTIDRFGVSPASITSGDFANGMKISNNDGRMWVEMKNASNASSVDVTFDIPRLFDDDLTIADIIVAIAPGGTKYAGPWKTTIFNQNYGGSTDNAVHINLGSTGITFSGYRLEPA